MAYQYEARQVNHGNAKGIFAVIEQDVSGNITFGTPYPFTGLISTSFSTSQDSTAYYADNVEHIRLLGNEVTEGDLTVYQIPKTFFENHLGKQFPGSGAMISGGLFQSFVWIYNETITTQLGQEYPEWHIFTNCKASAPTGESTTDTDTVTPKEITIPVTVSPNQAVVDTRGNMISEIVWPDPDYTVNDMIDNMFGDTPTVTIQDLITSALGSTPVTP